MAFAADKTRQGAAGTGGYEIDQSLRFDRASSSHLSFTPASAGNRKTWTWSSWNKPCKYADYVSGSASGAGGIFGSYASGSNTVDLTFTADSGVGRLNFYDYVSGYRASLSSSRAFQDLSAWYHIMLVVDTTQATAANRVKLYVNGENIVDTLTTATYPSQNQDLKINNNNVHYIGRGNGTYYSDSYMAEVHFIDGTALTPTSFGETGTYGEWKPIEVEDLTYGTNGFYLSFAGGGVMSATGGNSTATDGDYKAASFTADGTFTPSADGYVEYLVIGGGGNGAGFGASSVSGGGGGAGGYRTGYLAVTGSTAYSITVGAATADSVFSSITSDGGGNGGAPTPTSGGSGGGSGAASPSGAAGVSGQGNAGGTGTGNWGYTTTRSGGGGGSGGAGGNSDGTNGGSAGAGTASSITGSSVTYAAGGEGVAHTRNTAGTPGAANTGNGGGGTGGSGGNSGGAGGTGIVILRYKFQ